MYKALKRIADLVFAILGLVLTFPIFLVTMIALLFLNNGKPFFFQKRPGKKERIFKIVKFKSMNDKTDVSGQLLPNHERITRFGRIVRKTSIDELPQLFNVVKGEMSLVGPRPLKVDYLPLYNNEQKQRHSVRPGITGWAQINGRNAISHTEKFKLDVWYVQNQTFILDLKILVATVKKVFIKEGVGQDGYNVNTPFNGSN